jgi:hypothetical protein
VSATAPLRWLSRVRQLGSDDAILLGEALLILAASSTAIRLLPFSRVGRLASRSLGRAQANAGLARIVWAVQAWGRRVPWRAVCFQQGLATQIMLRRRGLDSTLYFGAAPNTKDGLAAHVWVKLGDTDIIGCEEAPGYAVLAKFPSRGKVQPGGLKRFDAN